MRLLYVLNGSTGNLPSMVSRYIGPESFGNFKKSMEKHLLKYNGFSSRGILTVFNYPVNTGFEVLKNMFAWNKVRNNINTLHHISGLI